MKWTKGTDLYHVDRLAVLNSFVHRYTGDHKPQWAQKEWKDGKPYPLHFASDEEWLTHTEFRTRNDGRLDGRAKFCLSRPTFPNNPEARKETTT